VVHKEKAKTVNDEPSRLLPQYLSFILNNLPFFRLSAICADKVRVFKEADKRD